MTDFKGMETSVVQDIDSRLLRANDFVYEAPVELSLVSSIRHRVFPSLKQEYRAGETGYIDISMGADMLRPEESFLRGFFAVANTANEAARTFSLPPFAGVASHFRTVIVRSRTGTEVSRAEFRNWQVIHEAATSLPKGATFPAQGGDNADTGFGHQLGAGRSITLPENDQTFQEIEFMIPLTLLSPFFNTNTLVPSGQLGQIRLEFQFVGSDQLGARSAGDAVEVIPRWRDLEIWTQAVTVVDSAQRALTAQAGAVGLVYVWEEIHTTTQSVNAQQFTMQGTKAASRALSAWLQVRLNSDNALRTVQPYASESPTEDDSILWNLGSVYYPVKTIVGLLMLYMHALIGQSNFTSRLWEKVPQLTYLQWATGRNTFHDVSLERSKTMPGNGSATNSSRPLTVNFKRGTANAAVAYLHTKFMRLLLIYSDGNVQVKE